jgi:hypothetical protein
MEVKGFNASVVNYSDSKWDLGKVILEACRVQYCSSACSLLGNTPVKSQLSWTVHRSKLKVKFVILLNQPIYSIKFPTRKPF